MSTRHCGSKVGERRRLGLLLSTRQGISLCYLLNVALDHSTNQHYRGLPLSGFRFRLRLSHQLCQLQVPGGFLPGKECPAAHAFIPCLPACRLVAPAGAPSPSCCAFVRFSSCARVCGIGISRSSLAWHGEAVHSMACNQGLVPGCQPSAAFARQVAGW